MPVFARFSTVAGSKGSKETPRNVRGFAVKFYTDEGNWDLVAENGVALEELETAFAGVAERFGMHCNFHDEAARMGALSQLLSGGVSPSRLRDRGPFTARYLRFLDTGRMCAARGRGSRPQWKVPFGVKAGRGVHLHDALSLSEGIDP